MKKRTILGYLFTAGVLLFCFEAVYSFDFWPKKYYDREETSSETEAETEAENKENIEMIDHVGIDQEMVSESDDSDPLEANAKDEVRTNHSMLYVVGQYDWSTGIVIETVEKFPEELIGMTRKELLGYLREHPGYGSLLSFSEHAVYLRKSDEENWSDYTYYLILEDERLMVYYLDQRTLYLDTGISADELTEEDRLLLTEGFYIKDTPGLFDYLQTVTS